MNRSLLLFAAMTLIGSLSAAADIGGLTVNGEASFDYNFLSSKDKGIPYTSAASNETYRLNLTQLLIKKETDQISLLGRMVYTTTTYATSNTATTKSNLGTLDQLEVFYKIHPTLHIGFGRFLTTMGFESLLKSENYTYGYSIAFQGIVPGYGEGLRLKYIPGEWLTATVTTYNQATYNAFGDDYTPTKTTEVSVTGIWNKVSWFAGYYFGKDGALPADRNEKSASSIWTSYKFFDQVLLAITYDSKTTKADNANTKWSDSTGAVISYQLHNNTLTGRYELVRGADNLPDAASGLNYGSADKINSITLTDKIALNDNFKVYVEYRNDQADQSVLFDKDGNTSKSASLWTLGAVASF